jgi:hypothetical protein
MSISLRKYETEYTFRGRKIKSYYGNPAWSFFVKNSQAYLSLKEGNIPRFAQYRPDIISQNFLETPDFYWLIMLINGFYDPYEHMKVGTRIRLPNNGL